MKIRLLALSLLVCGIAYSQNPYVALQGVAETAAGITVSQPRSILSVDVTVERDVTLAGVYARYAQKFLGLSAPLTDKTVRTVKDIEVALFGENSLVGSLDLSAPRVRVMNHSASDEGFAQLQPDKNSMEVVSLEEAARRAAATIFSLRKSRMDLITGQEGENVFGGGLAAALAEIARLEQSYMELFLGKRITTTETRRYVINLSPDKRQYIVCRFSASAGLLPENDLSGDMVLLQIEPSGNVKSTLEEAGVKDTNVVLFRIADISTCVVSLSGREYARVTLPLFEFGRTIRVAAPRKR